jgi:type II secretory pathway pseudopilin PulG
VRKCEDGFSLIEILLATALFVVVSFAAFEALRQLVTSEQRLEARHLAYEGLERLTAQLRAEARSATAIWSSSPSAGGGHDDCVQLDFATADGAGPKFWSYRRFPNHAASDAIPGDGLERLAGSSPIPACGVSQTGAIVATGIRSFSAQRIAASSLPLHVDRVLGAGNADSPFAGSNVADAVVGLGYDDVNGKELVGGNALVEVAVANDDADRTVDLLPGVFPTGYTLRLAYTCDDRCTVGHDTNAPKTLNACAMSGWQLAWSSPASYTNKPRNDGSGIIDVVPATWWIAGTFVFSYSGTAPDGSIDRLTHLIVATNVGQAPPDGTHGMPAPFGASPSIGVAGSSLSDWYGRFAPYVDDAGTYNGAGSGTSGLQQETQRCGDVNAEGLSGGYSYD